jgi:hypothetical protein
MSMHKIDMCYVKNSNFVVMLTYLAYSFTLNLTIALELDDVITEK